MSDPAEQTVKIGHLLTEAKRLLAAQDWAKLELVAADMSLASRALIWECAERCVEQKKQT